MSRLTPAQAGVIAALEEGHRLMGYIRFRTGDRRAWGIFPDLDRPRLYKVADETVRSLERSGRLVRVKSRLVAWRECVLSPSAPDT